MAMDSTGNQFRPEDFDGTPEQQNRIVAALNRVNSPGGSTLSDKKALANILNGNIKAAESKKKRHAENVVAAAMLKATSSDMQPESRIMLGRYGRLVKFNNPDYRLVQLAFHENITPEAVDNPNLILEFAESLGCAPETIDNLLDIFVLVEELFNSIVLLTGADFDLSELVEEVALKYGEDE